MNVSCNRDQLLNAFQTVAPVVPTRSPKEVLKNNKYFVAGTWVKVKSFKGKEKQQSSFKNPSSPLMHQILPENFSNNNGNNHYDQLQPENRILPNFG